MHKTRLKTVGVIIAAAAAGPGVSQAWTAWQAYHLGQKNAPTSVSFNSPSPEFKAAPVIPPASLGTPTAKASTPASPAATSNSPAGVSLASEVGEDYTKLRDLLVARKYKEADQETTRKILYVSRRKKEGWLDSKAIENFPCQDLRTMNQLWLQNSNGRFGFSVQEEIYNQVWKDWEKFYDQVEWRVNDEFKSFDKLIFEMRAPRGHLPREKWDKIRSGGVLERGSLFMSRLEECKI